MFKAKRAAAGAVSKVPRLKGDEGDRTFVSGASITGRDFDTDLRRAVTTEELRLHWQPIYAADDGKLRAYEALLRWDRPGHGPVPPGVFIPFAESSGLIEGMDAWTMQAACAAASKWPEDITVSVNLSAHWFGGADVVDLVKGALSRFQITPHRLCIEITERTVIARRDVARAHIEALHELGVRVAMDDFGTGFSALAYLRDLPFDVIKLDRSFVSVLGASARCDAVACSIIDLGHRLGMTVCAEGVQDGGAACPAAATGLRHGAGLPAWKTTGETGRRGDRAGNPVSAGNPPLRLIAAGRLWLRAGVGL